MCRGCRESDLLGSGCDYGTHTADKEQNGDMGKFRRVDFVAAVGALLALVTTVNYIWMSSQAGGGPSGLFKTIPRGVTVYLSNQVNRPVLWVVVVLLVGIVLASYGARLDSLYRRAVLLLAGAVLVVMGKLALSSGMAVFSIGIPLVVAGLICFVAVARRRRRVPGA
jgi:hypothetical protein